VFILILNSSDYKHIILVYLLNIWVIDTCAMFGGKALQGPKLAPVLSPNKTWSGLICGAIGSIFAFIICDKIFDSVFIYTGLELIPFGILFTIIAQNSDLLVSFFKRKHGIKDSGTIFPGHGGMLDRCDSFILTAPILLYIA
jgi:phosphatidate cytidylyltransferase